MIWKNLKTVNITTSTGEPDTIHFEENGNGGFRIVNDYGSECITFDIMTGLEMLSRFNESITEYANQEIDKSVVKTEINSDFFVVESDSSDDCQGDGV